MQPEIRNLHTNRLLSLNLDGEASYNTGAESQVSLNIYTRSYELVGVNLATIFTLLAALVKPS